MLSLLDQFPSSDLETVLWCPVSDPQRTASPSTRQHHHCPLGRRLLQRLSPDPSVTTRPTLAAWPPSRLPQLPTRPILPPPSYAAPHLTSSCPAASVSSSHPPTTPQQSRRHDTRDSVIVGENVCLGSAAFRFTGPPIRHLLHAATPPRHSAVHRGRLDRPHCFPRAIQSAGERAMFPKSLHSNTLPESGGAAALAGSGVVGEGPERRVLVALHSNSRAGGMGEGRGEREGAVVEYDLYSVLRPVSGAKPDGS